MSKDMPRSHRFGTAYNALAVRCMGHLTGRAAWLTKVEEIGTMKKVSHFF